MTPQFSEAGWSMNSREPPVSPLPSAEIAEVQHNHWQCGLSSGVQTQLPYWKGKPYPLSCLSNLLISTTLNQIVHLENPFISPCACAYVWGHNGTTSFAVPNPHLPESLEAPVSGWVGGSVMSLVSRRRKIRHKRHTDWM